MRQNFSAKVYALLSDYGYAKQDSYALAEVPEPVRLYRSGGTLEKFTNIEVGKTVLLLRYRESTTRLEIFLLSEGQFFHLDRLIPSPSGTSDDPHLTRLVAAKHILTSAEPVPPASLEAKHGRWQDERSLIKRQLEDVLLPAGFKLQIDGTKPDPRFRSRYISTFRYGNGSQLIEVTHLLSKDEHFLSCDAVSKAGALRIATLGGPDPSPPFSVRDLESFVAQLKQYIVRHRR